MIVSDMHHSYYIGQTNRGLNDSVVKKKKKKKRKADIRKPGILVTLEKIRI